MDLSLNIVYWILNLFKGVHNIPLERTVSQILYFGPSSYFIKKNRETFRVCFKLFFLDFIKQHIEKQSERKIPSIYTLRIDYCDARSFCATHFQLVYLF